MNIKKISKELNPEILFKIIELHKISLVWMGDCWLASNEDNTAQASADTAIEASAKCYSLHMTLKLAE